MTEVDAPEAPALKIPETLQTVQVLRYLQRISFQLENVANAILAQREDVELQLKAIYDMGKTPENNPELKLAEGTTTNDEND